MRTSELDIHFHYGSSGSGSLPSYDDIIAEQKAQQPMAAKQAIERLDRELSDSGVEYFYSADINTIVSRMARVPTWDVASLQAATRTYRVMDFIEEEQGSRIRLLFDRQDLRAFTAMAVVKNLSEPVPLKEIGKIAARTREILGEDPLSQKIKDPIDPASGETVPPDRIRRRAKAVDERPLIPIDRSRRRIGAASEQLPRKMDSQPSLPPWKPSISEVTRLQQELRLNGQAGQPWAQVVHKIPTLNVANYNTVRKATAAHLEECMHTVRSKPASQFMGIQSVDLTTHGIQMVMFIAAVERGELASFDPRKKEINTHAFRDALHIVVSLVRELEDEVEDPNHAVLPVLFSRKMLRVIEDVRSKIPAKSGK